MIVADTNLVSYLLITGEHTEGARRVHARDPDWRVPPLWRSELLNVLATTVRADVLDAAQAGAVWESAVSLLRGREVHPRGDAVLRAALRDGLSAYDAQFVVVAEDLGVALVTSDRRVLAARPGLAVSIEAFGAGAPPDRR